MTNEERAVELVKKIERLIFKDYCNQEGVELILAYSDEIRRECAENARNAIFDFGIGDKEHIYSPIIRKDLAAQLVERAILGKEAKE